MAITKILNIMESEGRNPATHLKNALEYIQNPDKTEECILVGGINCLPDTAFEQMEETKNIFHKTGKRQGYHVIISFSPEEKVTAEQAMYVLEHFVKDVLGDDYEAVYAVHTDREHMHGHLIWNSVSMTTGKKYNSPKGNWKNHLQPITNKYCDELGLSIMPAEYSRNQKNISRDKWEKEMSMKEIILRDAKMCAYAAGNVEHFKYLMKRLGYVFKKDAWMEVQAPGFRYYHKLAKLDEMFSEDMLRHYVDMPWMAKPYFYSSDIRGLHRAKLSPYQKRFYAKLYRLRIVEQKRFVVGGAKYTEELKRFHQLQDEYLLLVNNDIKDIVELVNFRNKQEEKIQQIEDRQHEIYRESSSRKRSIKNEEQYREYQIWHGIQLESGNARDNEFFEEEGKENDILFELSINNKYHEIMDRIEKEPSSSVKAYYYSLVKYTDGLSSVMNDLKELYASFDYQKLSNQKCYELAIYEFNNTCMRSLSYLMNEKENYDKLNLLLDQAAARYSRAYNTIKDITNKGADIQEMNDILLKHEEYYMKKASISKMGGTIYGDLFLIRQIAYDYYLFYKKNHLMLDWFNNVEKMVTPYIKAIFCTYYPDEFQGDFHGGFMRTNVSPYPIELLDVDMIVKHIKQKELRSIVSHYKVDSVELSDKFDISLLFEDFCLSMKEYWNLRMIEQLESFSFLLSLCKLNYEQNSRIVKAFVLLLTPDEKENVRTITNNIYALSIYVKQHFDKDIKGYGDLLKLLINSDILLEATAHSNAYPELIQILSELADKKIYNNCCKEFDRIKDNNRQKTLWVYIHRRVLLKYDESEWKNYIEENLNNNWEQEIFQLLYEKILSFNDKIKEYYVNKLKKYASSNKGVYSYPDHKAEAINQLVIYILLDIANENDIEFMKEYAYMSDYLEFIFNPESFDYRNIKISDTMWCNFINSDHYRERILEHKSEFWNKEEEKRIELGFGSSFENRVAYKYLFD